MEKEEDYSQNWINKAEEGRRNMMIEDSFMCFQL